MGFWVCPSDANGARVNGAELQLSPGPKRVGYPTDVLGSLIETSGGNLIRQIPPKDARRRTWVWENLPLYQNRFLRFVGFLEAQVALTRQSQGLAPWVFLKDEETAAFQTWTYRAGTVTSSTSTTLVDSAQTWATNVVVDGVVAISTGVGAGQSRSVLTNTATVLTVEAWTIPPGAGATYRLQYAVNDWVRVRVLGVIKSPTSRSGASYDSVTFDFVIDA